MQKILLSLFILVIASGCYGVKQKVGAIQGTVVDAASGRVLTGVLVERYRVAEERSALVKDAPLEESLSDEDGEFALSSQHHIHFKSPFG